MNKSLLLLRHAKSSWKKPGLEDHARPLNARGCAAAARIGRLLNEEELGPDLILCSTAIRARQSALFVMQEIEEPAPVYFLDELYHAEFFTIAEVVSQIVEPTQRAMIIGHNPGLQEFLSNQADDEIHFPTAALARLDFEFDRWSSFTLETRGKVAQIWRPREMD